MDRKAEPKKDADKEKESEVEKQPYVHEPILERLSLYDNVQYLVDAGDYYSKKYGMLLAPPVALLHSDNVSKNEMIEAIAVLDLDVSELGLYWIAQMMYLLPLPNFWTVKKVVKDRSTQVIFQYREKHNFNWPPSICFLDQLVENIRKSDYKDVNKAATASYVFKDAKTGLTSSFTNEDLAQSLETEKNRMKSYRPSIRNFWINVIEKETRNRMYSYPKVEGTKVYNDEEKGIHSAYTEYQPTGFIEEQKMEQFWLDKQNKALADKRETEEFIHFMKDWASAKQRLESELIRKNGQSYSGSNFEKRAFRLTNKVVIQNPRQFSAHTRGMTAVASKAQMSLGQGTTMATSAGRPQTEKTVYMHTNRLPPDSIYRKASARNFHEEYLKKLESGGYRDRNRKNDHTMHNKSLESSIEIEEDKEELDERDENILNQIETNIKHKLPQGPEVIDVIANGRVNRAIRTATFSDKKDFKLIENSTAFTLNNNLEDIIHLEENSIADKRVKHIRSNYKFIKAAEEIDHKTVISLEPISKAKVVRTMSVYGKQTQHEIIERPFTAILNTDPIKFTRNNELREIDAIKKRFNKYEINIPLRKIESALINPEIKITEDITKLPIPAIGSRLLSRPAEEKKKKKGKKGKGRDGSAKPKSKK